MKEIIEKEDTNIENMIYEIRGKEVMLDSDLAKLYHVETKRINEAVKNNPEKFPLRFSFIITNDEVNIISRSKISTLNKNNDLRGSNIKYMPRAFTEQGVYMLATILRSKKATEVSIRIMDTFVKMRHYINYNKSFLPNKILLLENKIDNNTKRIDELFDKFNPKDIVKDKMFFKGEFYDAYSLLFDILDYAKSEIIIIDNYAGKELFDILKNINKKIIVISSNINESLKKKYEKQYKNISFINSDLFHDRFIFLDRCLLYICGCSFKDLGKKCFYIGKIEESIIIIHILDKINKLIDKNI